MSREAENIRDVTVCLIKPMLWLGVPRSVSGCLLMILAFDLLAAHTYYVSGCVLCLYCLFLLLYRTDTHIIEIMQEQGYKRRYY